MKITEEMIVKASCRFDGTCPWSNKGGECSLLSVEECNKCLVLLELELKNED